MARSKGSFGLAGAVEPKAAAPLDARSVVKNMGELTAVGSFPYPYIGMETYVVSEGKKYRLIGNDPTVSSNWEEVEDRTPDQTSTDLADDDYIPFYDVSASGKKKTLWSNIKAKLADVFQTKMSNATYLAKIGEQGGNPTYNNVLMSLPGISHFDKSNLYSTTEKVVGCWTDGRPLYQKTVSCGDFQSQTDKSVAHGITNLDKVINTSWFGTANSWGTPSGNQASLHLAQSGDYLAAGNSLLVYVYGSNIHLFMSGNQVASADIVRNVYVTLQYTKTTDTANSFNYASENDYSTSETVIGTWIDGEKIYQKTISLGNLSNVSAQTEKLVSLGIIVDKYIYASGIMSNPPWHSNLPYTDSSSYIMISLNDNTSSNNKNKVGVLYEGNLSWVRNVYITLQYTKTS